MRPKRLARFPYLGSPLRGLMRLRPRHAHAPPIHVTTKHTLAPALRMPRSFHIRDDPIRAPPPRTPRCPFNSRLRASGREFSERVFDGDDGEGEGDVNSGQGVARRRWRGGKRRRDADVEADTQTPHVRAVPSLSSPDPLLHPADAARAEDVIARLPTARASWGRNACYRPVRIVRSLEYERQDKDTMPRKVTRQSARVSSFGYGPPLLHPAVVADTSVSVGCSSVGRASRREGYVCLHLPHEIEPKTMGAEARGKEGTETLLQTGMPHLQSLACATTPFHYSCPRAAFCGINDATLIIRAVAGPAHFIAISPGRSSTTSQTPPPLPAEKPYRLSPARLGVLDAYAPSSSRPPMVPLRRSGHSTARTHLRTACVDLDGSGDRGRKGTSCSVLSPLACTVPIPAFVRAAASVSGFPPTGLPTTKSTLRSSGSTRVDKESDTLSFPLHRGSCKGRWEAKPPSPHYLLPPRTLPTPTASLSHSPPPSTTASLRVR
ncbi:hypothetical protein C8J57DRAFT_1665654 [Mycena rebaudengoi]|nr:hypothetical protein C8J57DRAFT_1665654 [Mycena rebaudengoi]